MSKMTLDTLAIMVQKGFLETAKQSDLLALEKRVDKLEKQVAYGFNMVAQEFKDIRNKLEKFDIHEADILDLQLRMDNVEKRLKAR
jgi:tetrahydromethanopterin S-methyltransferase subunit G